VSAPPHAGAARRLAWFTPLPPETSGVAIYNVELLPGLTSAFEIDVFVDARPDRFDAPGPDARVYSAHDFVWKHFRRPYDLIVYQLGNAPCHDYMWAYLVRYPGLVVLHDGQLHHARARSLIAQGRADDYRDEFRFNHPDSSYAMPELGIAGLLGELTYFFPMRRLVIEVARLVVVHSQWLAKEILDEQTGAPLRVVEMGVRAPQVRAGARQRVRARHGIRENAVVFVAFGRVTPEKRISQAIRALASIREAVPDIHLLLCGETVDYYDPLVEAAQLGVSGQVTATGWVSSEDVDDYLETADVCLCMRWPTSRETSAAWLRCLAAGRATVITDLAHTVDVSSLDPRTWTLQYAPAIRADAEAVQIEAACISIDVLDEEHSLKLAMRRLATDLRLRTALGGAARELWASRFTLDRMVAGYRETIEAALTMPPRTAPDSLRDSLPAHFLTTGTEHADRLMHQAGLAESTILRVWRTDPGLQTPYSSSEC